MADTMELIKSREIDSLYRRFWPAYLAYIEEISSDRAWLASSFGYEMSCGNAGACDRERLDRALRQRLGRFGWPIDNPSGLTPGEVWEVVNFFLSQVAVPTVGVCETCFSYSGVHHEIVVSADYDAARRIYTREVNDLLRRFDQSYHFTEGGLRERTEIEVPKLEQATATVRAALEEAEVALRRGRPEAAVDRLHTALHGYLRSACESLNLDVPPEATVIAAYKAIRTKVLDPLDASDEVRKILNSLSSILDAINNLRNNRSLAHPSELLPKPEAELFANAVSAFVSYLSQKLVEGEPNHS